MQILRPSQWRIQGRGPGARPPPLSFRPNWGPKGRKNFLETAPLSQGLDPALQSMCTDKTAVNFCVELWFPCKIVIHLHVVAEKISFTKLLRLLEYIVDKLFCDKFNDVNN